VRLGLVVLCLAAGAAAAQEERRITEIEIRKENVFTPAEAAAAFFPYRVANVIRWPLAASS